MSRARTHGPGALPVGPSVGQTVQQAPAVARSKRCFTDSPQVLHSFFPSRSEFSLSSHFIFCSCHVWLLAKRPGPGHAPPPGTSSIAPVAVDAGDRSSQRQQSTGRALAERRQSTATQHGRDAGGDFRAFGAAPIHLKFQHPESHGPLGTAGQTAPQCPPP